ncbi:hypothetical protein GGTG_07681 [Gaeumannomyces tritici R3-111a-1]|uniref:Nephrocystin 3-like N-terminal domain-containing protein n=1 Tax=Gaeumannomyces tritici (strain R3-111a-1) TaxID=644352 RepID=J3P2D4_GAET3|nr:hypothetical protein GGTG_07681 [Gaeumannomyces tritici R3-111a-1]EJT73826.1 hypothetical protein GGTG_07681 [Gaeumannomyces tritici R3-111a-1]
MAAQINLREQGLTVLHQADHPKVDIVFVHGFTGHPKNTWTWQRAKHGPSHQKRKHDPGEGSSSGGVRKFLKVTFRKKDRSPSPTATSSSTPDPSSSETTRAAATNAGTERQNIPEEVYWPKDLVPTTVPDSRIFTYGYDTNIRHWAKGPISSKTVYDHGWDLLCSLEEARRGAGEGCRPILFVAHSLGGIVVKEALRRSRRAAMIKPHIHAIFEATLGLIFFGTPHRGANPRRFLHHVLTVSIQAVGVKTNDNIVNTLMPHNPHLKDLSDEFAILCVNKQWPVYSFQEEYGVTLLGGAKVVDDDSSCLNDVRIETKRHISSNHMDMCRFSGLEDARYNMVSAALTFIIGTATTLDTRHETPHQAPQSGLPMAPTPPTIYSHSTIPASSTEIVVGSDLGHDGGPAELPFATNADEEMEDIHGREVERKTSREAPVRTHRSPGDAQPMGRIDAATKSGLVNLLFFSEIDQRLTGLTAAQGKTCRWFLSKPEYRAWRDLGNQSEDSTFLWIKGNPGTGKSTLIKFLFEQAREESKGNPMRITLSFFFRARGSIEETTTVYLYRSLLYQLFQPPMEDLTDGLEWMTAPGARGVQEKGWDEETLKQTLKHTVSRLGHRAVTILVDALDECDQTQVAKMVSFFEELCEHAMGSGISLRICFSSRHYPAIVIQRGVELILEAESGHTDDIEQFIKARLRLGSLGKTAKAAPLRDEIRDKSSGIFLWVVLVIEILNQEPINSTASINASIDKLSRRLKEIPPGLHDLFEMILARDGNDLDQLDLCLKWVLFATRPLKPQELYFAVQFGLDKDTSGLWDREEIVDDQLKAFVSSSSKGLAEVTRNKAAQVQFIHESVRDFLLGRYGQQWSGASVNFEGHSHDVFRDCCWAQLNAPVGLTVDIPDEPLEKTEAARTRAALRHNFPFLEYAVFGALAHANSAQQHDVEQGRFLQTFPLSQWAMFSSALEQFAVRRYSKSVDLLYILAERNMSHLIPLLCSDPKTFFSAGKERYGPPIFAALATESHDAVATMLQGIQKTYQHLPPPLQTLAEHHFKDLAALYLRNRGLHRRFPRDMVFSSRKTLLSYMVPVMDGSDMNSTGAAILLAYLLLSPPDIDTALLFCATVLGYDSIVQSLLDTGQPDLSAKDEAGRTLAANAAAQGHHLTQSSAVPGPSSLRLRATAAVSGTLLQGQRQVRVGSPFAPVSLWGGDGGRVGGRVGGMAASHRPECGGGNGSWSPGLISRTRSSGQESVSPGLQTSGRPAT